MCLEKVQAKSQLGLSLALRLLDILEDIANEIGVLPDDVRQKAFCREAFESRFLLPTAKDSPSPLEGNFP